ncbi:polysaccharide deacetylase [Gemmatirosa kalamazoonensis]|uniref:Polysaccharide deacetylase n=1 Tax=Gemmatirosa kalamazoonensis TaxID=861299 RepID=W0RI45_9BACT|nr:polysaccharide deacetylase [Gemmatirosa kalamazoonensis]
MRATKALLRRAATSTPVGRLLRLATRGRATVFMLHRFASESNGGRGAPALLVEDTLDALRRGGYRLVSLSTLLDAVERGDRVGGWVAFTVDDGYADFAEVALPLFARYEAPCTVFVTSGAVDRACWFWWDQVEYLFERTRAARVAVATKEGPLNAQWADAHEREAVVAAVCARLKSLSTEERLSVTARLAAELGVALPETAPAMYASMTWEQVRACERAGVTIGGHTVTHPVLARCDDTQAEREIRDSLQRLREQCAGPIDMFAYPNGQPADYGAREMKLLATAGIRASFATHPGYVTADYLRSDDSAARWRVPRFPEQYSVPGMVRVVTGFGAMQISAPA